MVFEAKNYLNTLLYFQHRVFTVVQLTMEEDKGGYKQYLYEDLGTIPKSTLRSREEKNYAREESTRILRERFQVNSDESEVSCIFKK